MLRQIITVVALSALFIFNTVELNRRKMAPIEFFLWQLGVLVIGTVSFFQDFGQKISTFFGFELLANFIFAFALVALMALARAQSRQIGKLQSQLQEIVQTIALKEK